LKSFDFEVTFKVEVFCPGEKIVSGIAKKEAVFSPGASDGAACSKRADSMS
jgi:hypothetical protein